MGRSTTSVNVAPLAKSLKKNGVRGLRPAPTSPAACHPRRTIRRSHPCETGKRAHGHPRTTPGLSVDRPAPGIGTSHQAGATRADWARRKPTLLLRLPVSFLLLLDEMVEVVEKEIGHELAGQIADRNAAAPLQRRQQVIAGVVHRYPIDLG